MPAALPLQANISQNYTHSTTARILTAQYGNGYEQRVKDGINNMVDEISLTWSALTAAEYATLIAAFVTSNGSDYFTYTMPGDSADKKWVINGPVGRQMRGGDIFSVTMPFRQVFDI